MKHLGLPDPSQLDPQPDHCAPHPHLTVHLGGACRHCDHRSTSLELIRRHLSKTHRCKSDRKHWLRDDLDTGVQLQSWTSNGARGYWIVQGIGSSADVASDLDRSPRRRQQVYAIHAEEKQRLRERARNQSTTDTGIDDLALTSNWMRRTGRTGWADTLVGMDRRLLQALSQSPAWNKRRLELGQYGAEMLYSAADDERRLSAIGRAVDHFFDRCEDTARHTDHSVRC